MKRTKDERPMPERSRGSGPGSDDGFANRLREVAAGLRDGLEPLLIAAAGETPRPVHLSSRLGLDKTLASRLVRSFRAPDSLEMLHQCPAPFGLTLFIEAAAKKGIDRELCRRAGVAVESFRRLVDEFPGGRSALDVAVAGWLPEARQRDERKAKQAAFKAMSTLLGHSSDAAYLAQFLHPSSQAGRCDRAFVTCHHNIRRLRLDRPVTIAGNRRMPDRSGFPFRTLDGREPEVIEDFLFEEFSHGAEGLRLREEDERFVFCLEGGELGINEPATVTLGHLSIGEWQRAQTPSDRFEWWTILPRVPTKVVIADTFLHEDVYPAFVPNVRTRIEGLSSSWTSRGLESEHPDEIELSIEWTALGVGARSVATSEMPRVRDILGTAFSSLGWDADRFRGYRMRVVYPVPSVSYTTWFPLPEEPA